MKYTLIISLIISLFLVSGQASAQLKNEAHPQTTHYLSKPVISDINTIIKKPFAFTRNICQKIHHQWRHSPGRPFVPINPEC